MKTTDSRQRSNYLYDSKTNKQLLTIDRFFDMAWLPEQLEIIKQWRDMVAFETAKKSTPAEILYQHRQTLELINAAWKIRKLNIGKLDVSKVARKEIVKLHIKSEKKKIRDYPKHLKGKEILRPAKIIRKTFRSLKPADYKRILDIWLYDALKDYFLEESLTKSEVIVTYENLVKLYEAMWLIRERMKSDP
ncbi:hypothetical protein [Pedobacter agri]|uniref:hypothetical protein n=1 Tax=Pedobacter agri TaxID=454586 RepID=UPI0029315D17|nr:hypothetical protein [Pedobacter agri]